MALFEGKQNVHLYVRFLAKLGAPSSSEHLVTLRQGDSIALCVTQESQLNYQKMEIFWQ